MCIQRKKLDLIEWIAGIDDSAIINKLEAFKDDYIDAADDQEALKAEELKSIERGLKDIEERKIITLRNAIQEGIDSAIAHDFDPHKNLEKLKARRKCNG